MSPDPTPGEAGFKSLAGFQLAHAQLVLQVGADVLTDDHPARIAALVRRGVATGAVLDDKDERGAAQSLINYWASQLLSAARAVQREAERSVLTGETADPPQPPPLPELGDTLLAEFQPATLRSAVAAADAWLTGLDPGDRKVAHRLLLRLVRLRPAGSVIDAVPTTRGALRDLEPMTDGADRRPEAATLPIDELIRQLADTGAVRVHAGTDPETDQIALRSVTLLTDWPTLVALLDRRRAFRERAEGWMSGCARGDEQALVGRFRRARKAASHWAVNTLTRIGEKLVAGAARLRAAVGLPAPREAALMDGDALDEARAYHDRNAAERQFVVLSRSHELEGHKRNRVLAGVFAVLVAFAGTGWLIAALSAREAWVQQGEALKSARDAQKKAHLMSIQRDALEMQTTIESSSNLAIGFMLIHEQNSSLVHRAKKVLILQTLSHTLFVRPSSEVVANWTELKRELTREGAPGQTWFETFFNTDAPGRGYRRVFERVTRGAPADREMVEDFRTIGYSLREHIFNRFDEDNWKETKKAVETLRPVVLSQLPTITDRLVAEVEEQVAKDVRALRNVFCRLYSCELVLLQEDDRANPLNAAVEQFAAALWEWESSPDGRATPETVAKLKAARDQVHKACRP